MKSKPYIHIFFFMIMLVVTGQSYAQIPDGVKSYAVIGVFSLESNAFRFSTSYNQKSLNTNVRKNLFNGMYYVYAYESDNVEEARAMVLELRETNYSLSKTWLYNGNFNCLHIPSDLLKQKTELLAKQSAGIEELVEDVEQMEQINENLVAETEPVPVIEKKPKEILKKGTFWVYFNAYNVTDLTEVTGKVTVMDAERNKELSSEPMHTLITLNAPKNGTNKVQFVSDVFGFRIEKRTLDLDEPLLSDDKKFITTIGDSIIIDFPLRRYNKGDFVTLYNVYFYIDAAIMKEESIPELNQLLGMMKENENMKITLHGHTNGNSHGVVKHLDMDDKKFFSLNGSHHEEKASAKKLSLFRAHTIKYWLMDQGISEDRMEIFGWGGKKALYDKHGASAENNVRVEVEIVEE